MELQLLEDRQKGFTAQRLSDTGNLCQQQTVLPIQVCLPPKVEMGGDIYTNQNTHGCNVQFNLSETHAAMQWTSA